MRRILVILFCYVTNLAMPQSFFHRTYGGPGSEFGRGVVQTADGGYACVGSTNSYSDGSSNVYLIKLDESGDYQWGRNIGEPGKIEWGVDIVEDNEGNIILAGYSNNTPDSDYQGMLIKLSDVGDILWTEYFGESDWDFFESITVDNQNDLYICGNTYRENAQQGWVIKISTEGEMIWEELISAEGNISLTGIAVCDNAIGVVGYEEDNINQFNQFLSASITFEGELNWMEAQPGWGNIQSGRCSCNSESILISGSTYINPDDTDFYVTMQDIESGEIIKNERIFSSTNIEVNGTDVLIDDRISFVGSGEFIYFEGIDGYGAIRNSEGDYISSDFTIGFGFTGTDIMYDTYHTNDGGYVTVGESDSYGNNYQLLLAKVAPNGDSTFDNNDFLDLATPVHELFQTNQIKVYPNPTVDYLTIKSEETLSEYSISDLSGKILIRNWVKKNPERIDLSGFENGVYILRLESDIYGSVQTRILKL